MGKFQEQVRRHADREFDLVIHPRRGEPFAAAALYSSCRPKAGTCNVRIDWTVLAPDGSLYGSEADKPACSDCTAPGEGRASLADTSLNIVIEPHDPAGDYEVLARLRDAHSGSVIELKTGFTVVD